MKQLRHLLSARLTALRNRASSQSPGSLAAALAGVAAVVGALLLLGDLAAPALLEPPADVITSMGIADKPGELPPGAAALEAAFWLAALAASVLTFRGMELLFRRGDLRAVESLPIPLYALWFDRLMATLAESVLAVAVLAPFFIPLVWHGGAVAAATSLSIVTVGLLTTAAVGLAVHLAAGKTMSGGESSSGSGEVRDVYGGSGQVFLYAPGVALAISMLLILLAKLAFGEVLKAGEATRAFGFGMAIMGGAFLVAVIASYRYFVAAFPRMLARFHEADFVGFHVSAQHQVSEFDAPRLGERLVGSRARPLFRAYALQYGRRYMMARWLYALGWLFGGLALFRFDRAAFPTWLVVTLPAIAAATLFNPWTRLQSSRIRPDFQRALPVEPGRDLIASGVVALRECLLAAGPYAALVGVANGLDTGDWPEAIGLGVLSLAGAAALNGLVLAGWALWKRSRVVDIVAPAVGAVAFVALANASLTALFAGIVIALAAHAVIFVHSDATRAASAAPP